MGQLVSKNPLPTKISLLLNKGVNELSEFDTSEEREIIANEVENKIKSFFREVDSGIEYVEENEIQNYNPLNPIAGVTAVNWTVNPSPESSWGESIDNASRRNQRFEPLDSLFSTFSEEPNKFGRSSWNFKLSKALNPDQTDNTFIHVDTILSAFFYEGDSYELKQPQIIQGLSEATSHELGHAIAVTFHTANLRHSLLFTNTGEAERQNIILNGGNSESKFKLIFNGWETNFISKNATAEIVLQELSSLPSIGTLSEVFLDAYPDASPEIIKVERISEGYKVIFENSLSLNNETSTINLSDFYGRNVPQIEGEGTNGLAVNVQTINNGTNNQQLSISDEIDAPLGSRDLMSVGVLNIEEQTARSFTDITIPIFLLGLDLEWSQDQGLNAFESIRSSLDIATEGFQALVDSKIEPDRKDFNSNELFLKSEGLQDAQGFGLDSDAVFNLDTPENNNLGGATVGIDNDIEHSITITNDGATDLTFTPKLTRGEADFNLGDYAGVEQTLAFGESLTIPVSFNPSSAGLRPGTIEFTTNDPDQPTIQYNMVGTGIPESGIEYEWGRDYVSIEYDDFTQRTVSNGIGDFMFEIPTFTEYDISLFEPDSGLIASNIGFSGPAAALTDLSSHLSFRASTAPDSDFDGLPDDIESAIGSDINKADTDGDSLSDWAEINNGLDPIAAQRYPTGIIASLPLRGEAKKVSVEGSTDSAGGQTIYVATGSHGLAIVDGSQFNSPIIQGQLELSGDATDVAVDSNLKIAAVATNRGGLQLVDVSDPMMPKIQRTIDISAREVEVFNGVAYATVGASIRVIDLWTGEEIQNLQLPGFGNVTGLAKEGTNLYAFVSGSDIFSVIDISDQNAAQILGQQYIYVASTDVGVFAANGTAYLAGSGFRSIDVSDPTNPRLIGDADFFFSARDIALNGSGLGIVSSEDQGVGIYNVTNPQNTNDRLLRVDTPRFAYSSMIASGIAYVADSSAGLQVVNYLPFDNQGQAPNIEINTLALDANPNVEGIQVTEGQNIPIQVAITDDVQVRNVELLVDGEVVSNDVSYPFDLDAIAPNITPESDTVEIQVRATDTGGNSILSNSLTLELAPDPIPPEIIRIKPESISAVGRETVEIEFSEPIDIKTLNADSLKLFDSEGNLIAIANIQLRNNDRLVQLAFEPLEVGDYQLVIDANVITDRAGNILGTEDIVSNFTLKPVNINLTANVRDIDSERAGIQVNEKTIIPLQADITGSNEVPLNNVEFVVNGEVVNTDSASPFTYSLTAPKITPEFDSITIEARGIDSSGFAQVSEPIVVELVDTVSPTITRSNPSNLGKVAPGREIIRVEFSEYIAPRTVTQENFQVFDADNNLLEPLSIRQLEEGKVVELNFNPLETGEYRLEINTENIVDLSDNVLGTQNIVNTFSVEPAKVTTLSVGLSDTDPDKPGLQVLDNANFNTRANVSEPDGASISQVEFLIDDEVVATDTTGSVFSYNSKTPKITAETGETITQTLQARGIDNRGEITYTNAVEIEVIDTTSPSILRTNPSNRATVGTGRETVRVELSEAIVAEAVTQENFKVFDADDNLLTLLNIQQLDDGKTVELAFAPLTEGDYRLEIDAEKITDISGNALGASNLTYSFSVEPARVTSYYTNLTDIDPDKEGIQAYENTQFYFGANVTQPSGASISQVDFLINDEVIVTDRRASFFSYMNLPKVTPGVNTATIVARGTDNNGEFSYTDAVEVELVDITAPTVTQFNPSNAAIIASGLEKVRVDFSEYIAAETVTQNTFQVFDADDNLLVPLNIEQVDEGKSVELTFAPIAAGDFRLEIDAENVTDSSGNALGTEKIVNNFSVQPAKVTTLTTSLTDIDPNKEGIQAYDNSGSYYFRANVSQPVGTNIEQVDFLLNGEVIVTDTSGNTFSANISLPKISPETSTATIVARGTDSNGDFSFTEPLEIELVDNIAPTITQTNPGNLAVVAPGLEKVQVDFSEYIATESINSENIKVFNAADDLLVPLSIEQINDGKSVELTFAPLEVGEYRVEISATDITDLSDNALGTENIVRSFSVEPARVTTLLNPLGDIDPDKEGLQAYDNLENLFFRVNTSEPEGTNIEQVDFLINGEVVATDFSGSIFSAFLDLPKISPEVNTATVIARGTDSNGDFSYTEPLEIELVDIIAPTLTKISPANLAVVAPGLEKVRVDFSEYIATESINSENIKVFDAADDLLVPLSIEQINDGKSVELTFAPLEVGEYRVEISAADITDLSGNALGITNIVRNFSVETAKVTTLATTLVDVNPDLEGIQNYEYSRVYLKANTSQPNGTNIEQVDFLINDEVVSTDNTGSTFSTLINLPEITAESNSAVIVARGTDANGDVTFTDELQVELVSVFDNPALYSAEVVTEDLGFQANTSEFDFLKLVAISGNKPFKQLDYINVGEPQPSTLFAQLNDDEIGDRATLNDDGSFSIEIGNPDGSFELPVDYSFVRNGELIDSVLITAGDIDNDGDDDILIASQEVLFDETQPVDTQEITNGYLSVFESRGDGTLARPYYFPTIFDEPYSYPEYLALKDVEDDGILDWIVFDRDNLEVRPMRYNDDAGQLFWFTPTLEQEPQYIAVGNLVDRYISQDVIAADSTKTQLELVSFFTRSNDFDIFRVYDEDSRASIQRSSHTLNNASDYIAIEDLDGDNRYDWITVPQDRSQVDIYLKNSDGSNKLENTITFDTETAPSSVNMGDLNEDGNYDLLAVYKETGDFLAYFGNGDGTFADPITFNLPGEYDSPILRDLDGDGDEDLIAVTDDETSGNKTFSVFKRDGNGNNAEPFSHTFSDSSRDFVLKDLDGDGDDDLVGINSFDNRITIVKNQDNNSFGDENSYDLADFDYLSFQDLDGDEDLDLLTSTENQRSYSLLFNQGDGTLATPERLQFGNSVQYLGFKDLDGDNILDLTGTYDPEKRELFVALGQDDGSFGVTTNYSFTQPPTNISFVDVDQNGIKDLVSTNFDSSEVTLFLTYEPDGSEFNTTKKRSYRG